MAKKRTFRGSSIRKRFSTKGKGFAFTGDPKQLEKVPYSQGQELAAQQNFEMLKMIAEHTETTADVQVERNERIKQSMHLSALDPVSITPGLEAGDEYLSQRQKGLDIQSAITGGIRGAAPGISRLDESIIRKRSQNIISQQSAQYQQGFGGEFPASFQEQIAGEQSAAFFGQSAGQRAGQRVKAAPGFAMAMMKPAAIRGAAAGLSVGILDFALQYAVPDATMTDQEKRIKSATAGATAGTFIGVSGAAAAGGFGVGSLAIGAIAAREAGAAMARAFKEELTVLAGAKAGYMEVYGKLAMAGLSEDVSPEQRQRSIQAYRAAAQRRWDEEVRFKREWDKTDDSIGVENWMSRKVAGAFSGEYKLDPGWENWLGRTILGD